MLLVPVPPEFWCKPRKSSELGIALLSFVFFVRCSIRRLLVCLEPAALLVKGWMRWERLSESRGGAKKKGGVFLPWKEEPHHVGGLLSAETNPNKLPERSSNIVGTIDPETVEYHRRYHRLEAVLTIHVSHT